MTDVTEGEGHDRTKLLTEREAFRRWNDEMAQKYDPEAYHQHPNRLVRAIERSRVRALLRVLDVRPGQRVLEVGCGAGNILEQIHGAELFGLDLSAWLLDKARRRLGTRATLAEGWAEELPYPDAQFDRVYSSEVLEHVADPARVLAELRRVVRPDGRVVVSFPNEALIDRVKDALIKAKLWRFFSGDRAKGYASSERMGDEWHLHALTVDAVRTMTHGRFRMEAVRAVPTPVTPLRYVVALTPCA